MIAWLSGLVIALVTGIGIGIYITGPNPSIPKRWVFFFVIANCIGAFVVGFIAGQTWNLFLNLP